MKARTMVGACAVACLAMAGAARAYDNLWVHLSTNGLTDDKEVLRASNVIVRAANAGLKEVVWPGLDTYWKWPEPRKTRMREIIRIADANGIGIVPMIWSTGYGTMCGVDSRLIESVLMPDVPYVAKGGSLVPDISGDAIIENGGFEEAGNKPNTFRKWFVDHPGDEAFLDTQVFHSGKTSIRMEPAPEKDKYGHARMSQHVKLTPGRLYRVEAWFKVDGLDTRGESLRLQVYLDKTAEKGGSNFGRMISNLKDGWHKVAFRFTSGESTGATIWCGTWGAKHGKFWVDDISVEEIGLRSLAQREDSPRTVKNAATGKAYEFGKDWLNPDRRKPRQGADITFPLPAGSAIKEGEKVLIDTYVPSHSGPKMQISTCMSDPRLYELFRQSADALEELLHPKKWFLSLDEVRNGGTCPLCAARKTDMAHILASCVLRQHEIIRSVHPGAEIYVWSDMFDPFHNAKQKPYYGCRGTFYGIWDLLPHDIIMVLWYGGVLDKSVPFFTERGFTVMGSVCCDGGKPETVDKWKAGLAAAPGSKGFMYTTWKRDYGLLEEFASRILGKDGK